MVFGRHHGGIYGSSCVKDLGSIYETGNEIRDGKRARNIKKVKGCWQSSNNDEIKYNSRNVVSFLQMKYLMF